MHDLLVDMHSLLCLTIIQQFRRAEHTGYLKVIKSCLNDLQQFKGKW